MAYQFNSFVYKAIITFPNKTEQTFYCCKNRAGEMYIYWFNAEGVEKADDGRNWLNVGTLATYFADKIAEGELRPIAQFVDLRGAFEFRPYHRTTHKSYDEKPYLVISDAFEKWDILSSDQSSLALERMRDYALERLDQMEFEIGLHNLKPEDFSIEAESYWFEEHFDMANFSDLTLHDFIMAYVSFASKEQMSRLEMDLIDLESESE